MHLLLDKIVFSLIYKVLWLYGLVAYIVPNIHIMLNSKRILLNGIGIGINPSALSVLESDRQPTLQKTYSAFGWKTVFVIFTIICL